MSDILDDLPTVKATDRPWVEKIVHWFRKNQAMGRRAFLLSNDEESVELDQGFTDVMPVSPAKIMSMFRKYPNEIAVLLGYREGRYEKSSYSPSGRGAFGHLGGSSRRGRYHAPIFRMKK